MSVEPNLLRNKRAELYSILREEAIVGNYRRIYGLGDEVGIEHVKKHAELEAELTDELIGSIRENRWEVFSTAYTKLYRNLPWLNLGSPPHNIDVDLRAWGVLVGRKGRVFEIGSGKGRLIEFLAERGNKCCATEITSERGERLTSPNLDIEWHRTDGVNLSLFEHEGSFDYVISDQVVEHLHPDDLQTHFENAYKILKEGGLYIARTPHRSAGPHDLSQVFGLSESVFMHLHEFGYGDFQALMKAAGFSSLYAVLRLPLLSRMTNFYRLSSWFFRYQLLMDRLEERFIRSPHGRRFFRKLFRRLLLLESSIWIAGQK
jgi:SAM-dependent methyltransferase